LEQGRDIHTSMAGRGRAIDPFSVEEGQGGVPPSPLQLGHEEEEEDGGGILLLIVSLIRSHGLMQP